MLASTKSGSLSPQTDSDPPDRKNFPITSQCSVVIFGSPPALISHNWQTLGDSRINANSFGLGIVECHWYLKPFCWKARTQGSFVNEQTCNTTISKESKAPSTPKSNSEPFAFPWLSLWAPSMLAFPACLFNNPAFLARFDFPVAPFNDKVTIEIFLSIFCDILLYMLNSLIKDSLNVAILRINSCFCIFTSSEYSLLSINARN